MSMPLLTTKLYIPPVRSKLVPRPLLIERLNQGLTGQNGGFALKLTLISASAGFGKTTLVSEWVNNLQSDAANENQIPLKIAWLSLDAGDNDPKRFLTYLAAALQTTEESIGRVALAMLQSPQPPLPEAVLISLINEIAAISHGIILILDDYHVIESQKVDKALTFTIDHLPPQMHLVIASRIDPSLPLSRLRASGQMTELREADLRFSADESSTFLGKVMGLNLSAENAAALRTRTEGWIAGLQLAALSMQGLQESGDIADFIDRFTGSDRFIQDYLADEVLRQRPKGTKDFLLQTSILNRLSGPLCDAVCLGETGVTKQRDSQAILEALEAANLFIVPLDNERRWYRYHHLFADLLRQRLYQSLPGSKGFPSHGGEGGGVAELHIRASAWYEDNGLEIEAFHHAAAANDVERAARLIEGAGMPLILRGAMVPVQNWLASLPTTVLDARPSLWVTYASTILASGQQAGVEQKLRAAEAALPSEQQGAEPDDVTRDLVGRIAATRAILAIDRNHEEVVAQSRRALEYLHPDNLSSRTATTWTLGIAYQLQGERAAAGQAFAEAISFCEASGNIFVNILASTGLGNVQEAENQLYLATETYQRVLQLAGDPPHPAACEAHLGLARIHYEWNDMDAAHLHWQQSTQLARQIDSVDAFASCGAFLSRLKLTQGDVAGAAVVLAEAEQFVRQHNFVYRMPEVAAAQVLTLLRQGDLAAAANLAEKHELPLSQARVHLARGDSSAALEVLVPFHEQVEAKGWQDERLKVMVLQALALLAHGEKEEAVQLLGDALALAEPGGFIRIFVDEGTAMAQLLHQTATGGVLPDYVRRLLAEFEAEEQPVLVGFKASPEKSTDRSILPPAQPLIEPLSERELEVLQLIAEGLSNREIGERLFLALSTVKGHNRRIYGKLQVQRRTEAIACARELGLL